MKYVKNHQILIPVVIFIGYILIRFWNLTNSCLFFDEIFSLQAARLSWNELFWFVAQDLIHPPLFYVLLKIWLLIGGESLFWVRLFPVIFSIMALIPFCLLCRELKLNYWSCVFAMTFFAVNGCLIKYAQEVRMYSVLLCLGLFSIWLFIRFLNERNGKGGSPHTSSGATNTLADAQVSAFTFSWLIIINVLLINTHYFGWLIVFSQLIAVLILQREKLKQCLLMIGLAGISFFPWALQIWPAARINADYQQNLGWAEKPTFSTLYHFLNDLFEPFYFQVTNAERAETIFINAPLIFICVIATILSFQNWKNETEKREIYLLIVFLKVPILLAFVASWLLPVSVWGTRHLIIAFPLMMIFFAIVLGKIKIKELKIIFISIVFFFLGLGLLIQFIRGNKKPVWCAWEDLAANLETEKTQLYVFEDLIAYHVWSARREKKNVQITVVKGIEGLLEDKAYFLPRGFDEIKITDENGFEGDKFWIAFRDKQFNEYHPPLSNLRIKGYQIGEPKVFEAQGVKTFLVEVEKEK